ncbi:MAG: phospholipase D family protein [Micropepsaceae bacterium]
MTAKRTRRRHSSWLSFLDAHRLKASLASFAAVAGMLVSMGIVDINKLPPWALQILPQLGLAPTITQAATPPLTPSAGTSIRTCFTPGQDCTTVIVQTIDTASSELLVQAYGFTTPDIAQAIIRAKDRGVSVQVVLDKSNEVSNDSGADMLVAHGITPKIDSTVTIAHNKVMIIDGATVITGSFNFTASAQKRNAENVLIVTGDQALAAQYRRNFETRLAASRPYLGFIAPFM